MCSEITIFNLLTHLSGSTTQARYIQHTIYMDVFIPPSVIPPYTGDNDNENRLKIDFKYVFSCQMVLF